MWKIHTAALTPSGASQAGCRKLRSRETSAGGAHHDGARSAKGVPFASLKVCATSATRKYAGCTA